MKFYLAVDNSNRRHVVVAPDQETATQVMDKAGLGINYIYELTPTTFSEAGFLISDK